MTVRFQFPPQPPVTELNITELSHVMDALIVHHRKTEDDDKRAQIGELITRLNDVWREYFLRETS